MKRLAVCVSGHMRSYRKTIDSFNSLMSILRRKYECDVFVHTWNLKESETLTYYEPVNSEQEEITEDLVKGFYNPKGLIIEEQEIRLPFQTRLHNQSIEGLLYAEHGKAKLDQLRRLHGQYDFVLCTRPDVFYYNYDIPELGETETLWLGSVFHNNAASDVVLFSSSKIMDVARNFSSHYPNYLDRFNLPNNESYFKKYLSDMGINFKYSKYCMPRDWKIVRSWLEVDDFPSNDRLTWSKEHAETIINFQKRWSYYR